MGVIVHVPAFEIELSDTWGTTVQEVVTSLPIHYGSFCHFLEEHAGENGTINLRDEETGFHASIDFTWTPPKFSFKRTESKTCKECKRPIVEVDTNVWYHDHERYLSADGSDDFDRDNAEYFCNGSPITPN